MTNDEKLMQQALEALQKIYIAPEHEEYICVWWPACEDAILALRERLAQPEPIKESSVTHSHLWIGDLYGKEKNT